MERIDSISTTKKAKTRVLQLMVPMMRQQLLKVGGRSSTFFNSNEEDVAMTDIWNLSSDGTSPAGGRVEASDLCSSDEGDIVDSDKADVEGRSAGVVAPNTKRHTQAGKGRAAATTKQSSPVQLEIAFLEND